MSKEEMVKPDPFIQLIQDYITKLEAAVNDQHNRLHTKKEEGR